MPEISYKSYEEGYDARVLRLGNLALDFRHPKTKRPFYHPDLPPDEIAGWATSDDRPLCYLAAHQTKGASFGLGLHDLLTLGSSNNGANFTVVVGKDGSKVELIEPHKFFEQVVLANEEARFWLQSRLAVAHRLQRMKGYLGFKPKIWLLTGLYYMTDAATCSVHSQSSSQELSGKVPLPEPSGLATLLRLTFGATIKLNSNLVLQRGSQITGPKVWAALWQRVDARYQSLSAWDKNMGVKQLKLLDVYSSDAVRGGNEDVYSSDVVRGADEDDTFVTVSLMDQTSHHSDDAEETENDEYWRIFDKEVQELEEDYYD